MAKIIESIIGASAAATQPAKSIDDVTLIGDPAIESELVLIALREQSSPDEFTAILENAGIEMELYEVIDSAEVAMEAQKNIVRLNKLAKFSAVKNRACIRLAFKANDALYAKYRKYRDLTREIREKIYAKYGNKATRETRIILQNRRRSASAMTNNETTKSISEKMDREVSKLAENDK